jgi:hypothetical protein
MDFLPVDWICSGGRICTFDVYIPPYSAIPRTLYSVAAAHLNRFSKNSAIPHLFSSAIFNDL